MKKIITVIIIFTLVCPAGLKAQSTKQGTVLLGLGTTHNLIMGSGSDLASIGFGKVNFTSSDPNSDETVKTTTITLIPKVGYFVVDNLVIGANFTMALSSMKGEDEQEDWKYQQTYFLAGPFARCYIPCKKVLPFIEAGASFGSFKDKYEENGDSDDSKSGYSSIGGGIGIAIPLGKKATFDILLGYNSLTEKDSDDNGDDDKIVVGTFGVKFGFIILLGGK